MLVQSLSMMSTTSTIVEASASPYRTRLDIDLPIAGLGLAGASIAFVAHPAGELSSQLRHTGWTELDRQERHRQLLRANSYDR